MKHTTKIMLNTEIMSVCRKHGLCETGKKCIGEMLRCLCKLDLTDDIVTVESFKYVQTYLSAPFKVSAHLVGVRRDKHDK